MGLHSLILVSGGAESSPISQATSTPATPTATATSAPSAHTSSPASQGQKLNVGAIAGGVVGGVALIGIIAGLIAFIIMRRRKSSVSTPSTYIAYGSPQTVMNDADMKYNSTIPGKLYVSSAGYHWFLNTILIIGLVQDPNDPTTFPSNGYNIGPNDPSSFPSDPSYSPYSGGSPQPGVAPTITGNATLVGGNTPIPTRATHYTGAPEL